MFKRLTAPERAAVTEAKRQNRVDLAEVTSSVTVKKALTGIPAPRQAKILRRLADMPHVCRRTYLQAITGKSQKAAIRAQCWECMGHQRPEVDSCTDLGCPLWALRPSFSQHGGED